MSINLEEHKDEFLFLPLGGANEIGVNVNLYHYKGKWLMVDCGSGFAEEHMPGVDMIVADIGFIKKYKKDILGLVLTHAHEDHMGGVQYLFNQIECPIYATNFTANFLKIRLAEYNLTDKVELNVVAPGGKIDIGPFSVEMVGLTHSAPEMQALMIRTEAGNIFHTGDWKFDHDPVVGPASDEDLIRACGKEGILALVCDSTNVFTPGVSGSEGDLRKSLISIIKKCPKLIVVTTFASNLARLDTIIYAAKESGRKVVLTGRSLHRMIQAAEESGYEFNSDAFIDERDAHNHKREELLVIATGCQGEQLAAVSKMATDKHFIKLAKGDTVIFSSKIIPGNDKRIYKIFNIFVRSGIEVITERDHFVHVSGHPAIDELTRMYELLNPKIAIPVHGEPVHIHEHAKLARKIGVAHALEVENGSLVRLNEHAPGIITKVHSGYFGVDGNCLIPDHSPIFKVRKKMSEAGIVIATLIFDKEFKLLAKPVISYPGCLDDARDSWISNIVAKAVSAEIGKRAPKDRETVDHMTRSCIRKILKNEIGKVPVINVNLVNLGNSNNNGNFNKEDSNNISYDL